MKRGIIKSLCRFSTQAENSKSFYFNKTLDMYAQKDLKRLSLRQLAVFGRKINDKKLIDSANYIRTELPVRIAHRIKDFQMLPLIVGLNPHIQEIYSLYWVAFNELKKIKEIKTFEENMEYCKLLDTLLKQHENTIPKLALGMTEVGHKMDKENVTNFLERNLISRISRRVLCQQHLSLSKQVDSKTENNENIGVISTKFNIYTSLNKSFNLAINDFKTELKGFQKNITNLKIEINCSDETLNFIHIPEQIEYIFYQLFKNSIKSILVSKNSNEIIKLTVSGNSENNNELIFRISDEGSEFSQNKWSSTLLNQLENKQINFDCLLTKLYIEYLSGSMKLINLPGFGTDVFLKLPKLGTQLENLSSKITYHN